MLSVDKVWPVASPVKHLLNKYQVIAYQSNIMVQRLQLMIHAHNPIRY